MENASARGGQGSLLPEGCWARPLWLRWSLWGLPRDLEASFYTPEVERSCPRATSEWDEECLQTPPAPSPAAFFSIPSVQVLCLVSWNL